MASLQNPDMSTEQIIVDREKSIERNKTLGRLGSVALLLDSQVPRWTSQEDFHLHLCQALRDLGITPVLVYAERLSPDIEKRMRDGGAKVEVANYHKGKYQYFRRLGEIIRKHSVSLVHVVYFDYFSAVPWIARAQGVEHIIYEMQNSGEFKATSWKKTLLRLRTKLTTFPLVRVIAISEFVKQQLLRSGLPASKIAVRYLGVDTVRFTPDPGARQRWAKDFDVRDDEVILSTVAYLRPFKNPHILVEACKELSDRKVPVRLFVAGDGPLLSDLKELTSRLGVTDRIHWLGNVDEPRSLLQASDIFVLASVGEAFGLVLAEAMACGAPVAGSRSGSIPEVIDDGVTGILATPLDAKAFADAIEEMATDVERRKNMRRQAVERTHANFTVERVVDETIRIYRDLWEK